jgi:hypothetical protein
MNARQLAMFGWKNPKHPIPFVPVPRRAFWFARENAAADYNRDHRGNKNSKI